MMLRRIAHPMLAADSIVGGMDALLDPEPRVRAVADLVQRGEKSLPPKVAAYLPGNPALVVRVNAAARIGGGVLLALGKMPRLSVILLAATTVPTVVSEHDFWNEPDQQRRAAKRAGFLKEVSLFGGLVIASTDRAGKPSLTWRGRRAAAELRGTSTTWRGHLAEAAEAAADRAPELGATLRHRGERLAGTARDRGGDLYDAARDRGGDLLGTARHRGSDLYETAHDRGGDLYDTARDRGGDLLGTARDRGGDLLDTVRDRGADLLDAARDRGGDLLESARDRGERLGGTARDAVGRHR
ncbi:DoxX family protein [Nocardia sp. alder85J]|uniref:DoxX family protein n=1 Tax=Nocardia sp. alder85J TaxID=2862949 RepID=UPI001CD4B6FA|nr:DoxX family protein [Nocardia sp. alder85J]MCX4098438.1 DoxX family protein [Nocardia sp. alder85J]